MMRTLIVGLVLFGLVKGACSQDVPQPQQPAEQISPAAPSAHVEMKPTQGNQTAGLLDLMPMNGGVHISGSFTGLPVGVHGFHVHENGDCSAPDAASAGGHFKPFGKQHGAPDAPEHHAGDLGTIEADAGGNATVNIQSANLTLESGNPNSVIGKSVIVHAGPDDFITQPAGNSGARLACGVIQ